MFHELVSHNEDIKKLLEKGYAIAEDHGYLVIRDIPYLDNNGVQRNGAIVTKLVDIDGRKVKQDDHQIFFAGSHPQSRWKKPLYLEMRALCISLALSLDLNRMLKVRHVAYKCTSLDTIRISCTQVMLPCLILVHAVKASFHY